MTSKRCCSEQRRLKSFRRPEDAEHEPGVVWEVGSHKEPRVLVFPTELAEEFVLHTLCSRLVRTQAGALVQEEHPQFPVLTHRGMRLIAVFALEYVVKRIWNLPKRLLLWSEQRHLAEEVLPIRLPF